MNQIPCYPDSIFRDFFSNMLLETMQSNKGKCWFNYGKLCRCRRRKIQIQTSSFGKQDINHRKHFSNDWFWAESYMTTNKRGDFVRYISSSSSSLCIQCLEMDSSILTLYPARLCAPPARLLCIIIFLFFPLYIPTVRVLALILFNWDTTVLVLEHEKPGSSFWSSWKEGALGFSSPN